MLPLPRPLFDRTRVAASQLDTPSLRDLRVVTSVVERSFPFRENVVTGTAKRVQGVRRDKALCRSVRVTFLRKVLPAMFPAVPDTVVCFVTVFFLANAAGAVNRVVGTSLVAVSVLLLASLSPRSKARRACRRPVKVRYQGCPPRVWVAASVLVWSTLVEGGGLCLTDTVCPRLCCRHAVLAPTKGRHRPCLCFTFLKRLARCPEDDGRFVGVPKPVLFRRSRDEGRRHTRLAVRDGVFDSPACPSPNKGGRLFGW